MAHVLAFIVYVVQVKISGPLITSRESFRKANNAHEFTLNKKYTWGEVFQQLKIPKKSIIISIIPCLFDIAETLCANVALTLLAASITQMLRASLVIFTAILSVVILKMKLHKHHMFSLIIITVGLVLVGLSSVDESQGGTASTVDEALVGIFVLVIGQVFGALSYIIEEKIMTGAHEVNPLVLVGYEGLWGTFFMLLILVVFQFFPCSSQHLCNDGVIENSVWAIEELMTSGTQIVYTLLLLPLICFVNTSGTSVTAYGSAAARCTVEQLRNLLVWIYFMCIRVNGIYLEHFTIL